MSTEFTGVDQQQRLDDLGLCSRPLPELVDVDRYADALSVATTAPDSEFARCVARVDRAIATRTASEGVMSR